MAKLKLFLVHNTTYSCSSKKELKNYLSVKDKDIKTISSPESGDTVISIENLMKKERSINEAIRVAHFINEPTRIFKIGDPIFFSNMTGFCVTGIFADNKIILLENESKEFRVYSWQDIINAKLPILEESLFKKEKLRLNFYQTSLEGLIGSYYHFGINMNPEYQRGLVWSKGQKVDLIHSMFSKIDIGKFVLAERPYKDLDFSYDIVDGKQRLTTIIEFYEDRFKYKGYFFSQLSPMDRRSFTNTTIAMAKISERENVVENVVEYFVKFNRAGTPVDSNFLNDLETTYLKDQL